MRRFRRFANMKAESVTGFVFSAHASVEMSRRGLSEDLVGLVLAAPAQRWAVRPGRDVLQAVIPMGDTAKRYLVRVFLDIDRDPPEVVTAYRTSRVQRYWSDEP